MNQFLYTSSDVRRAITDLFADREARRVAISAFVGEGAEAFLQNPSGLELVCWPKAGGTNPKALRRLIEDGVQVSFCDSLHIKLYWAQGRGCVVTSANLSTHALGSGNLKEAGVRLDPEECDINRLLSSLKLRSVSQKELAGLDREHDLYAARNLRRDAGVRVDGFEDWLASPFPPEWKLGWGNSDGALAAKAEAIARNEYNVHSPDDGLNARKNDYRQGDWALKLCLKTDTPSRFDWMFVDFVARISPDDEDYTREFPYQAIQVRAKKYYPPPPFKLSKSFCEALKKTIKQLGGSVVTGAKTLKPSRQLLDVLKEHYEQSRA